MKIEKLWTTNGYHRGGGVGQNQILIRELVISKTNTPNPHTKNTVFNV